VHTVDACVACALIQCHEKSHFVTPAKESQLFIARERGAFFKSSLYGEGASKQKDPSVVELFKKIIDLFSPHNKPSSEIVSRVRSRRILIMASHPDVPNKVEVTAVTTTPHEHVTLNWTVKNFKTLVQSASPTLDGNDVVVASLPFKLVNMN